MGFFSNFSFLKRNAPEPEPAAEPLAESAPEAEVIADVAAAEPVPEVAAPAPPALAVATPAPPTPPAPKADAQARAQAEELVRRVVAELPNFIAVAVVESASGQILAGQWAGHSGGAAEVAAAHAELVRQARQAIEVLQLAPAEQLLDVLITLRSQLHLLQALPQHDWLLYLAIRTQDTNLALARTVLRQHAA